MGTYKLRGHKQHKTKTKKIETESVVHHSSAKAEEIKIIKALRRSLWPLSTTVGIGVDGESLGAGVCDGVVVGEVGEGAGETEVGAVVVGVGVGTTVVADGVFSGVEVTGGVAFGVEAGVEVAVGVAVGGSGVVVCTTTTCS